MSMEGLRQGAQGNSGKKGFTRATYTARYRPPAITKELTNFLAAPPNEEALLQFAEPIVLIKGQYPDNYATLKDGSRIIPPPISDAHRFRSHTHKVMVRPNGKTPFSTFRDNVCSSGFDPHHPQPCISCNQQDLGKSDSKAKDQWAFNIAHLGWYHLKPWVKDNQIQVNRQTGQPIMNKDECFGYKMENVVLDRATKAGVRIPKGGNDGGFRTVRQCEGCQNGLGHAWGDHRVLQLGYKHLRNILDIDDQLGKTCITCGTYVITTYYDCANQQCDHRLLDVSRSGWTNQQLDDFAKTIQQCPKCGNIGTPSPYYQCGFDKDYRPVSGGCPEDVEPKKTSIFDVVLWVQREGASTESEVVVKKFEPISKFRTPDGRPLSEHIKEIVKEPFDLVEMYAPETLDEQCKMLGIPNPYLAQQPAYQPYGQQGQQPGGFMPPQAGYGPQGQQGVPGVQGGFVPGGMPPQMPGGQPPVQYQQPMGYPNPGRPNYGK